MNFYKTKITHLVQGVVMLPGESYCEGNCGVYSRITSGKDPLTKPLIVLYRGHTTKLKHSSPM